MSLVVDLDDRSFASAVARSEPILIEFWGAWCGPCRQMAPVLEELAQEAQGAFAVAKLDIEANLETASKYDVMSVPTFLVFRDGGVTCRHQGAASKATLRALVRQR